MLIQELNRKVLSEVYTEEQLKQKLKSKINRSLWILDLKKKFIKNDKYGS